MAAFLLLASGLATQAQDVVVTDWVGRSRDEIVQTLGKPQSTVRRGETEILMFPHGMRAEVRGSLVVAWRDSTQAVLVRDGARYATSAEGKVRRTDEPVVTLRENPPPPSTPVTVAMIAPPVATVPSSPPASGETLATTDDLEPLLTSTPATGGMPALPPETEKFLELGAMPEAPPPPPWVAWTTLAAGAFIRLVVALVVLQLALKQMDVPAYLPDVFKVALCYTVIRDGIAALAGLGGYWEFITYFRVGDLVGLVALATLLFRFQIALSGLMALKVAVATKAVTYGLMLGAGLAITFGLQAFY